MGEITHYTEVFFELSPLQPAMDLLYADLQDLTFESFLEVENGLKAYVPSNEFKREQLDNLYVFDLPNQTCNIHIKQIEQENWNKKWEENFEPVFVGDKIVVKALFHEVKPYPYEILIQPKMAFGTGHHATTYLMLNALLDVDLRDKNIIDMGCGTGILAIFCKQKGAKKVLAIDIDKWSYDNTMEHKTLNGVEEIEVFCGDAGLLKDRKTDVLLANINKNVLLDDISVYAQNLNKGGLLLLSGFYTKDIDDIMMQANRFGFKQLTQNTKLDWVVLVLEKI